ncbi:MAG: lytic transglycosylase F [Gammaproteobacteria bacterium]|nr:MAG: lytic transglycosylase F [Gammaproteobacteria bacterium]
MADATVAPAQRPTRYLSMIKTSRPGMMAVGLLPFLWLLLLMAIAPVTSAQDRASDGAGYQPQAAALLPWSGDFDGMRERRVVRVLVVPNMTMWFYQDGKPKGVAYEALRTFEKILNKKYKPAQRHLKLFVVAIPTTRDQLIPKLLAGEADLAVASLTITPERLKKVDFSRPFMRNIEEIAVTGPAGPKLIKVEDLSGHEVFVRPSSSYHEHLVALNGRLEAAGLAPVKIKLAPEELEDEDLMEMVNAGLVGTVIVDDYKAELWAKVFKDLHLNPEVAINSDGQFGWMMRKESPLLKAEVDAFAKSHGQGTLFGNVVIKRYADSTRYIRNALRDSERRKFHATLDLFRRYADKYQVDHLLMMAQSYQESGLDHSVKSPVGAIGIMQVMPSTGAELQVGDISVLENNVHAGIKYMRFMVDRYYANEPMDETNKILFAFASYNAGPNRIARLRREAEKSGFDPNRWFGNVEVIAAKRVGSETVRYVSNIFKYYIAYRLLVEQQLQRELVQDKLTPRN